MIPFLPLEGESGDVDPLESDPLDVSPFVHLLDGVTHYDPCEHLQELCVVTLVSPAHRSDEA